MVFSGGEAGSQQVTCRFDVVPTQVKVTEICLAVSRFTRVQRVTCCLCLFISFVTASAMWYGVAPEDKADFDLGFVSLSYQQIGISIMATAVTFPLNLLWITMFRKADPISAKQVNADNELNAISSVKETDCT